ncbi:MAG: HAD-IA family hydrolase [Chthoniobacterales bacterium]|nr:HAD-IA family hydrolase [Chthoniobacterales bacterium]
MNKEHTSSLPKVLLFDFDGTIADTRALAFRILQELAGEFSFRALHDEELEKARHMKTQDLIKFLGISRWRVPTIAARGLVKFQEKILEIEPIAGIPEILKSLHLQGFQLGILTSNAEANVTGFLKQHQLDYFHFIRTSSKLFGKARELRRFMKEHRLHPHEIIYIGDETRDIEATQAVSIPMAAVTWGYNSAEVLGSMSPHYLVDKPSELLRYFGP